MGQKQTKRFTGYKRFTGRVYSDSAEEFRKMMRVWRSLDPVADRFDRDVYGKQIRNT